MKLQTKNLYLTFFLLIVFMVISCGDGNEKKSVKVSPPETTNYIQKSPAFNSDSAYYFIEKQVSFGPRVTNTKAHQACGDWLVSELQRFVETEQKSPVWKKLLRKLNFVKLDFDNLLKNPQEHTVLEQEQAKILENLEVFSTTGYWEILQQLEAGAATYVPEAGI
jgi:hypothetical protein